MTQKHGSLIMMRKPCCSKSLIVQSLSSQARHTNTGQRQSQMQTQLQRQLQVQLHKQSQMQTHMTPTGLVLTVCMVPLMMLIQSMRAGNIDVFPMLKFMVNNAIRLTAW